MVSRCLPRGFYTDFSFSWWAALPNLVSYHTTLKLYPAHKGKGPYTKDIVPLRSESPPQKRSGMARVLKGFQFYLHTHTFFRNRNKPYLPLPSQPQLVFIYRPRRDGRLSRPWCEVAQAEIRTRNLPIANLNQTLYHTATSAPWRGRTGC